MCSALLSYLYEILVILVISNEKEHHYCMMLPSPCFPVIMVDSGWCAGLATILGSSEKNRFFHLCCVHLHSLWWTADGLVSSIAFLLVIFLWTPDLWRVQLIAFLSMDVHALEGLHLYHTLFSFRWRTGQNIERCSKLGMWFNQLSLWPACSVLWSSWWQTSESFTEQSDLYFTEWNML